MNIFVLHEVPAYAARYHADIHVNSQLKEACQIMCTVRRYYGDDSASYLPTHQNHPCVVWARTSYRNYSWLVNLAHWLSEEYTYRRNKVHACRSIVYECWRHIPPFTKTERTPFALSMPEEYRSDTEDDAAAVAAYRDYYLFEKMHLLNYTRRPEPQFLT